MKQIGLLGGTFDPPHIGHFIIADEVKNALNLDEIWFIPTNIPPHKQAATSNVKDRKAMLSAVVDQNPTYQLKSIELERDGKSYSIDTVKALKAEFPDYKFYFIIGADMIDYLPKWHRIDELVTLIEFVGVKRPHYPLASAYPFKSVDIPLVDISSTEIKDRIAKNREVSYFLPSEVLRYIKEHHLYGYQ